MARPDQPEDIARKCAERKAERQEKLGKSMTRSGNPVGRPKSGNLVVKKFNDAIESGQLDKAFDSLIEVAGDPSHPQWAQASRMVMDRAANLSHFEKGSGSAKLAVYINFSSEPKDVVVDEQ